MKVFRRSPGWRRAFRLAGRLLVRWAENNDNARTGTNGEEYWVRSLLDRHAVSHAGRRFFAIDAGANRGGFTRMLLRAATAAECPIEVHAFEPQSSCVAELRNVFAGNAQVHIVPAAVGDQVGSIALYGEAGSTHASLFDRSSVGATTGNVSVVRLDRYLAERALPRVDLLKLDVEGYEYAALLGLGEDLRPEKVSAIQFEYGGTTLDAGKTLRDFYRLLEPRGYVMAKLFPRAIEIRPYRDWMETFTYANYVALSPQMAAAASQ
jgi:FkbM family methyltransferase